VDLNQLDAEKHGPMTVVAGGRRYVLPAASDFGWKRVAEVASNPHYFALLVWPREAPIKAWQIEAAQRAWCDHNGLPAPQQIQRLVMMMEKYGEGIEYDLPHHLPGVNAGQLWRDRRWRELLSYIDQLPSNSHKNRLMMTDEDFVRSIAKTGFSGDGRMSISDFGPTERILADLVDTVKHNTMVTQAVAGGKGPKPTMDPYPRPVSALPKIEREMRIAEHEQMKSLLLRNRDGDSQVS
jgi:hypothetical protein